MSARTRILITMLGLLLAPSLLAAQESSLAPHSSHGLEQLEQVRLQRERRPGAANGRRHGQVAA